jgi:hypothetical protein
MRKLLAFAAAVAALAVGLPSTSSAGGWVVVSLDSVPAVHAGEDTEVGFTVLRHGVTPESSDDLAVVVTGADGSALRFEAAQQGAVGHHVATITIPDAGAYTWKVTGQFVDAELGSLDVTPPSGGSTTWTWTALQWGSAVLALAMAGLVVVDLRRAHQRRAGAPVSA